MKINIYTIMRNEIQLPVVCEFRMGPHAACAHTSMPVQPMLALL